MSLNKVLLKIFIIYNFLNYEIFFYNELATVIYCNFIRMPKY